MPPRGYGKPIATEMDLTGVFGPIKLGSMRDLCSHKSNRRASVQTRAKAYK